jgi:hypothetical protein
MDENIKTAIEHAFNDNPSEMRDSLFAAMQDRVVAAIEQKKQEIASSLITGHKKEE